MDDKEPCQTTFCKALPLSGEGIVSANIQRSTPFAIRIRPAPCGDGNIISDAQKDQLGYVEVEINRETAVFKYRMPGVGQIEKGTVASITGKNGGLEIDKRVSYWFSFNRNDRILKYGKGYFMEETTLLTQKFPFPKSEGESDRWKFIFRPDESKEIVIKDVDCIKELVALESARLREMRMTSSPLGVNETITANLWSSILSASELAARVDVEKKVSFYPHPLTYNWSPFALIVPRRLFRNWQIIASYCQPAFQRPAKNCTRMLPLQTWHWTGPTASLDCRTPSTTASAQKARFFTKS